MSGARVRSSLRTARNRPQVDGESAARRTTSDPPDGTLLAAIEHHADHLG
jgi:hypothetical protein